MTKTLPSPAIALLEKGDKLRGFLKSLLFSGHHLRSFHSFHLTNRAPVHPDWRDGQGGTMILPSRLTPITLFILSI